MRMRRTEAALFALVLGFAGGLLLLAGISVPGGEPTTNRAGEEEPSGANGAPAREAVRGEAGTLLEHGGSLEVRVRDGTGAPIAGATVRLSSGSRRGSAEHLERQTDGAGRSTFEGLTHREQEVRVAKQGYGSVQRSLSLTTRSGDQPDRLDVILRRGDQTMKGQVVDPDRVGVGGVHVVARCFDTDNGVSVTYEAISGRDGRFEMRDIADLTYELTVAAERSASDLAVADPVTARASDQTVVIRLSRRVIAARSGVRVTGRVLARDGKPLGNVEIELTSASGPSPTSTGRALSDQNGGFLVDGVAPGSYRLTACGRGFATASAAVEVRDGAEQVLEPITLRRGGEIIATITDLNGKPLRSIPVRVIGSDPGMNLVYRTAQDGTIRASALPEGKYLVKVAMASGASHEVFLRDGDQAKVALTQ